ncbi:MAG TPA: DinB family protein [Chitinophagaceae bacterium]|nr:DinB family protein [Chitinophagaceae bacterium]
MARPLREQYPASYQNYIDLVPQDDLVDALEQNMEEVTRFFREVPEEQLYQVYAPGKWTIPAILLHISDTERIFSYRALRIARGDLTPMESFDEKHLMDQVEITGRLLPSLLAEFRTVRAATLSLYHSLNEKDLARQGTASGHPTTVIGIGYFIAGHANHHIKVISERYLRKKGL